ncbi:MAG: DUF642 domain-containing protein [Colwellia sp.]
MSNKNFVKSLALLLSLLAMSANANLIVNGSFESTDVNSSNLAIAASYPTGTSPLPADLASLGSNGHNEEWGVFSELLGWSTINSAGVEVQYAGTGGRSAHDGSLFLELDTHFDLTAFDNGTSNGTQTNGGITQEVTDLIPGDFYNFSFAFMGRSATANSNDFNVSLSSLVGISFINVQREFTWNIYNYQFQATATTIDVTFAAAGTADGKGALIDNVSLTKVSVPEPSVFALMLMGLFGFAFRKKS